MPGGSPAAQFQPGTRQLHVFVRVDAGRSVRITNVPFSGNSSTRIRAPASHQYGKDLARNGIARAHSSNRWSNPLNTSATSPPGSCRIRPGMEGAHKCQSLYRSYQILRQPLSTGS